MPVPAVGSRIPDFTLPLGTKDGRSEFKLSDATKDGPVILGFFPFAFSAPCTKEVCDFRDNLNQFEGKGAKVYGFSVDTAFVNAEFAKAQGLQYGIVSDANREVVGRIWDTMEIAGVKNVAKRGAMVVGKDGIVKWASASDDPKVWVGTEEIRKHV